MRYLAQPGNKFLKNEDRKSIIHVMNFYFSFENDKEKMKSKVEHKSIIKCVGYLH